jgi:prepilin-type N-terminal cleavage/methylation domain-containing protein
MRSGALKGRSGFTLVELMITIVVLFLVMNAVFSFFLGTISIYKKESKIIETGVETIVGLEILRKDVESAGYGLPWRITAAYLEPSAPSGFGDSGAPPRAILNADGGTSASDRLVIKAASVGLSPTCQKSTRMTEGPDIRSWGQASLDFQAGDRIVVIEPGTTLATAREFIATDTFANAGLHAPGAGAVRLIYGLGPGVMPFNRAEYMIETTDVPQLCAPGTGLLVKRVVDNTGLALGPALPLLDCVRDFQVSFGINSAGGGSTIDNVVADLSGYTAEDIRDRLRDIRISILAQEGRRDLKFDYGRDNTFVGNSDLVTVGRFVDVSTVRDYRWKIHNLVIRPTSLR